MIEYSCEFGGVNIYSCDCFGCRCSHPTIWEEKTVITGGHIKVRSGKGESVVVFSYQKGERPVEIRDDSKGRARTNLPRFKGPEIKRVKPQLLSYEIVAAGQMTLPSGTLSEFMDFKYGKKP